jgi:hypothetical protein
MMAPSSWRRTHYFFFGFKRHMTEFWKASTVCTYTPSHLARFCSLDICFQTRLFHAHVSLKREGGRKHLHLVLEGGKLLFSRGSGVTFFLVHSFVHPLIHSFIHPFIIMLLDGTAGGQNHHGPTGGNTRKVMFEGMSADSLVRPKKDWAIPIFGDLGQDVTQKVPPCYVLRRIPPVIPRPKKSMTDK